MLLFNSISTHCVGRENDWCKMTRNEKNSRDETHGHLFICYHMYEVLCKVTLNLSSLNISLSFLYDISFLSFSPSFWSLFFLIPPHTRSLVLFALATYDQVHTRIPLICSLLVCVCVESAKINRSLTTTTWPEWKRQECVTRIIWARRKGCLLWQSAVRWVYLHKSPEPSWLGDLLSCAYSPYET